MAKTYKLKDDNQSGKQLKILCNSCNGQTNHKILHNHNIDGEEEIEGHNGFTINWSDNYQILKCNGCDEITFRHESWFSEDVDYSDPDNTIKETLYPKRNREGLKLKDHVSWPSHLRRIYRETIDCFNGESYTLAAAGLRALVEGLCAELKVVDGPVKKGKKEERRSNLEGKINGLYEKHALTPQNAAILHEHRFLGNKALHELNPPSHEELRLAIDIIEHTLKSVFDMPKKYTALKKQSQKKVPAAKE